jgi:hypothetical protein
MQRREIYASQRASRSLSSTEPRPAEGPECLCELETERETGICAADRRLLYGGYPYCAYLSCVILYLEKQSPPSSREVSMADGT